MLTTDKAETFVEKAGCTTLPSDDTRSIAVSETEGTGLHETADAVREVVRALPERTSKSEEKDCLAFDVTATKKVTLELSMNESDFSCVNCWLKEKESENRIFLQISTWIFCNFHFE